MPGRELYGGMVRAEVPTDFKDVSDFREVPDTQEVFVGNNEEEAEQSLVFDIMELIPDCQTTRDAAVQHLEELASLNGVDSAVPRILSADSATLNSGITGDTVIITGVHDAAKWGRESEHKAVFIVVGLIRIPKVEADIVISYNVPFDSKALKAQLQHSQGLGQFSDLAEKGIPTESFGKAFQRTKSALESLQIVNWSLFG